MSNAVVEIVLKRIDQAAELYQRLILLAAFSVTVKTVTLQTVHKLIGASLINVNLELSRQLLELSERQRSLQLPRLLSGLINEAPTEVVLLDNIELLFDPSLKQDPMRLLQGMSRNKTLVVAWNGSVLDNHIIYAAPDHPEYKRYSTRELVVVNAMVIN